MRALLPEPGPRYACRRASLVANATPIERIDAPDSGTFAERYARQCKPVVLAGAARDWRATGAWSASYLKQTLGDVEIRYKASTCNAHPDFRQTEIVKMFARQTGRFGDFLDAITAGPVAERCRKLFTGDEQFLLRRRAGETVINTELKPLLDAVELPKYIPEAQLYTVWAWFSGIGARTWLHYDNNGCHNLNVQITGKKHCLLFAPEELRKLYPFPLGGANPAHNCSQIDIEAADLERFPEFRSAAAYEALLEPGDMLFIPAFWLHTFLHLGQFNSNVNFWWKPDEPLLNPVTARQALLDLVSQAGLDARADPQIGSILARLDEAAVQHAKS